jgi:hypothetical protein
MFPEETVADVDALLAHAYREPMSDMDDQELWLENLYARRVAAVRRANADKAILVGEVGPEIVVPGAKGTIIPLGDLGG